MIGEDGRITDAAPERFRGHDRRRGARGGGRGAARAGPDPRRAALHALGPVLAPLRRADRAADLAAVVLPHGRDGEAGDRGRQRRAGALHPRRPAHQGLSRLDGADPALVHLAPALVGAPAAGLVPRRPRPRSRRRAARPRARAGSRRRTCSTPGSARRSGRSRRSAGRTPTPPSSRPSSRPTCSSTARDIIFLWVARMIMTSLEFTGEVPFCDVYVHSVIQAPDGRRMSKSLGTGIDPLDEIDEHGADALRFGLLAMSSTQDVRFSEARVQQGRDLANKMWNASRLILLNARDDVEPGPAHGDRVEDRWIASRLQRAIASVSESIEAYDFSHAALDLYDFFWSELCDWYLEIVKPRLYDGDEDASATLLWALEQVLALAHPMMPFVTEEIYSYLPTPPRRGAGRPPVPRGRRVADRRGGRGGDRRRRSSSPGRCGAGATSPASPVKQVLDRAGRRRSRPHELVSRLARVEFVGGRGRADRERRRRRAARDRGDRPGGGRGPDRGAAREAPRRGRSEARASSPTRASSPRRPPTSSTRSGRSSTPTGPSSRNWADSRAAPKRSSTAARSSAGSSGWSGCGGSAAARDAAEPLRLDPRRRHQRQDLGDADDRGAARGARRRDRRLRLAPHHVLARACLDPRRADLGGGVRRGARARRAGGRGRRPLRRRRGSGHPVRAAHGGCVRRVRRGACPVMR